MGDYFGYHDYNCSSQLLMGFLSRAPDDDTFNQNTNNYAILPSSPHFVFFFFEVVFSETTFQIYYLN